MATPVSSCNLRQCVMVSSMSHIDVVGVSVVGVEGIKLLATSCFLWLALRVVCPRISSDVVAIIGFQEILLNGIPRGLEAHFNWILKLGRHKSSQLRSRWIGI